MHRLFTDTDTKPNLHISQLTWKHAKYISLPPGYMTSNEAIVLFLEKKMSGNHCF